MVKLMGEMADMALEYAAMTESLLDEYVSGDMSLEDAYEEGFIDESGCETEGVQAGWDRAIIGPAEVDNALSHAEKDFEIYALSKQLESSNTTTLTPSTTVSPSCSVCNTAMSKRAGKYGNFYHCLNRCAAQKTISEAAWINLNY